MFFILSTIYEISLGIRRFHDMGRAGWFSLLLLIPLAALWPLIAKGQSESNKYGNPPRPELDVRGIVGL